MKTYLRWIRWNGHQMQSNPVRWLLGVMAYNLVCFGMYAWFRRQLTKQVGSVESNARYVRGWN